MLVKFVTHKQDHWDELLDTCVFAYNTSVHESTRFSPFEIMFGRKATLPIDLNIAKQDGKEKLRKHLETGGELSASAVEKLANHRQGIIEEAKANIKLAQAKQKEVYDRKHAHPDAFKVGSQVLKKDFLRKKRANGKMDTRYLGPYVITKKLGKGLYALELVADPTQTVSRVHGAHLKPYHVPPPIEHDNTSSSSHPPTEHDSTSSSSHPRAHPSSSSSFQNEDSIPPLPPPMSPLSSLKHHCRSPPCNTTRTILPAPSDVSTEKNMSPLADVPKPLYTSSPIPGKGTKPHSSEKENHAARDLMFQFRQSKVKQASNPEVIDVEGYGQRKATRCRPVHRKKQPWINNGVITLSTADRKIIGCPTGWLSDDIINAAQTTPHEQFGIPGFQGTEIGQYCGFNVEPDEFIQILHTGKDHWVTISTIGTKHPEVVVYDSMYSTAPNELQQQIAALLHTEEKTITLKFAKVSMQTNGSDCGVYAIAFATALCLGKSPQKLIFDESRMRPQLIKCLADGSFTMFPVRQTRRQAAMKATKHIAVHCTCRMPNVPGIEMIECSSCKNWFHVYCASPSHSVLNCTDLSWYCNFCQVHMHMSN